MREWRRVGCKNEPRWSSLSNSKIIKLDFASMSSSTLESSRDLDQKQRVESCSGKYHDDYPESKLRVDKCSMLARPRMNGSPSKQNVSKFEDLQFMNEVNLDKNCANISEEEDNSNNNNNNKSHLNGDQLMLSLDSPLSSPYLPPSKRLNEINNLESTTRRSNQMKTIMEAAAGEEEATATSTRQPLPTTTITEKSKRRRRKRNLSGKFEELKQMNVKRRRKMVMMIKQFNSLKESSLIAVAITFIMFIIFTFTTTTTSFTSVTATTLISHSPKQATFAAKTALKTGKFISIVVSS